MTGLVLCLLQYEGRTPQVQVFGYNAGLLSPERAYSRSHT